MLLFRKSSIAFSFSNRRAVNLNIPLSRAEIIINNKYNEEDVYFTSIVFHLAVG